jgi:hypothetical protein
VLHVAILLPEGVVIADWLREQFPSSQLETVRRQLAVHRQRVRWMDDDERIFQKAICPLLDTAGKCSIYPVRPLACRGAASLDRNSCRDAFSSANIDGERLVMADLLRRAVFDVAFMAMANALRHHGLDDRSIELGAGVLAYLEDPRAGELLLSGGRLSPAHWE